MTLPTPSQVYGVQTGTAFIYPTILKDYAPTPYDVNFPVLQRWIVSQQPITSVITGISAANPCVITAPNNFQSGEIVTITNVSGMTELNGNSYLVLSANQFTFSIDVDSSLFTPYSGGGIASIGSVSEYVLIGFNTTGGNKLANWIKINAGISPDYIQQLLGDTGVTTTLGDSIINVLAAPLTSTISGLRFVTGGDTVQLASTLNDGELIIGSSGNPAKGTTLTAGSNITITNAPGQITINAIDTGGAGIATGFYAYLSVPVVNVTGDGTTYIVPYDSTLYNQNTAFDFLNNKFVAPQNGIYQFFSAVDLYGIDPTHTNFQVQLVVTGTYSGTYNIGTLSAAAIRNTTSALIVSSPIQVEMATSDTAQIQVIVSGGPKTACINGGAAKTAGYFTGSLVQNTSTSVGEFTWDRVSVNQTISTGKGYFVVSPGGAVQLTLPAVAAQGDTYYISLRGATSWEILQQVGQTIYIANQSTTTTTGSIKSTAQGDTVRLVCSSANTDFVAVSFIGNIQVS